MFQRILEKGLNELCHDQWRELCEVLGFMRKPCPIIADEPDLIVGTGFFGDRTEAVNEALKFLIRLAEQIKSLSKNVKTDMCPTDALMSSMDGGDL